MFSERPLAIRKVVSNHSPMVTNCCLRHLSYTNLVFTDFDPGNSLEMLASKVEL